MSKVALIADSHIGARGDSIDYLNYFSRFYKNIFFPYLDEHNIDTIVDLGDTLDRRKFVNFKTLEMFRDMWIDPIKSRNITLHTIVGNHQTFYRNTNETNSADLLLSEGEHMTVHRSPREVKLFDRPVLFLPWINRENRDDSIRAIENSHARIAMGHLEISGYQMVKGIECTHGLPASAFSKFSSVFSGHFHIKQKKGNIEYMGTPYEITFADAGLPKGFHIFDTETLELEFIQNPERMHYYLPYDDSEIDYNTLDIAEFAGKMVKINVIHKSDSYAYDKFIDRLIAVAPLKYSIIDTTETDEFIESIEDGANDLDGKDTMQILSEYVNDNFEAELDRQKITSLMRELYNEATSEV